jgi:hypothetical protein
MVVQKWLLEVTLSGGELVSYQIMLIQMSIHISICISLHHVQWIYTIVMSGVFFGIGLSMRLSWTDHYVYGLQLLS